MFVVEKRLKNRKINSMVNSNILLGINAAGQSRGIKPTEVRIEQWQGAVISHCKHPSVTVRLRLHM